MLPRIEVWSSLACASGVALGALRWLSARTEVTWDDLVVSERLTVQCVLDAAASAVRVHRVLVLHTPSGTEEYRIVRVSLSSTEPVLTIVAEGILTDLTRGSTLLYQRIGGRMSWTPAIAPDTPSGLLATWVVPFAPSYVALGTVEPTTVCWPSSLTGTPLAAARSIAEAARLASGVDVGLRLRRNGTTNYLLDLVDVNASAATVRLRTGQRTGRLVRQDEAAGQVTRAIPMGRDGRGIGDNWWRITAVGTNAYLEIVDILGSSDSPILEDGALTGAAVRVHDAATLYPITGSVAASKRLEMNPTPASPVGKYCTIVTSAGEELGWIDAPSAQSDYGVVLGTVSRPVSGLTNWVMNGDMADWSGSRPAGWGGTGSGPTKITSVGDWETGGQSARYKDISFVSVVAPGINLRCAAGSIITQVARVRVDATGSHFVRFRHPITSANEDVLFDSSWTDLGVWVSIVRQYSVPTSGLYGIGDVGLHASGTGTTYLDHVMAYVDQQGVQPSGYVRGSGGATLWLAGVQALRTASAPRVRYDVEVADLAAPGVTAPGAPATLVIGGPIELLDGARGWAITTRVRRIARSWETGQVQIDVATVAPGLAALLGSSGA